MNVEAVDRFVNTLIPALRAVVILALEELDNAAASHTCQARSSSSNTEPELLTVDELAEFLRVHPRTIYNLVSQDRIPVRRNGTDRPLFLRQEIMEWTTAEADRVRRQRVVKSDRS